MPKDQSTELTTLVSHTGQAVVAHTFNPSTREVEKDMAGQRKEYKARGNRSSGRAQSEGLIEVKTSV